MPWHARRRLARTAGLLLAVLCAFAWGGESPGATPAAGEVIEPRLLPRDVKRQVAALELAARVKAPAAGTAPLASASVATGAASARDEARRQREAQALAQGFLRRSRIEGDPRLLAYAQSALAPWLERADVPVDLQVLQATVLQSQHRFGEARALLQRALAREPGHVQAGLTLSTVRIVEGDLAGARRACEAFAARAPQASDMCRVQVDGLTATVAGTWPGLRAVARDGGPPWAGWAAALLGESLFRLGHAGEALHWLAQAAAGGDLYDSLALVDALLASGRPDEAAQRLEGLPPTDAVLLRRLRAAQLLKHADAASLQSQLEARFAAATAEEGRLHARERALFFLWTGRDARVARDWAATNLAQQKEAIDLRIAAEAAWRAADGSLLAEVRNYVARSGLRDRRLETLFERARAAEPSSGAPRILADAGVTP